MKEKQPFYIGWQDEISKEHKSVLRRFTLPILVVLPLLAFIIVALQKPFKNHQFELGKLTKLTGVYHSTPVPILEVSKDDVPDGYSSHILLVGYGKFGAEGIMEEIEELNGSIDEKKITLQGTLIYGDGKTVLELTKKRKSFIGIESETVQSVAKSTPLKIASLQGEILDPKCYFGVMKPGEGKIHKSCAIRCISGGIPPVLRAFNNQRVPEYYVLLGEQGEKINDQILDKIAEQVQVKGNTTNMNGWNYLYANPNDISIIE